MSLHPLEAFPWDFHGEDLFIQAVSSIHHNTDDCVFSPPKISSLKAIPLHYLALGLYHVNY